MGSGLTDLKYVGVARGRRDPIGAGRLDLTVSAVEEDDNLGAIATRPGFGGGFIPPPEHVRSASPPPAMQTPPARSSAPPLEGMVASRVTTTQTR